MKRTLPELTPKLIAWHVGLTTMRDKFGSEICLCSGFGSLRRELEAMQRRTAAEDRMLRLLKETCKDCPFTLCEYKRPIIS